MFKFFKSLIRGMGTFVIFPPELPKMRFKKSSVVDITNKAWKMTLGRSYNKKT